LLLVIPEVDIAHIAAVEIQHDAYRHGVQVIIYKKPVDVHTWMSKNATVLIISYDMFSALRKQSLDANLKTAGSEPTGKVMLFSS
jgi:hypothetical protein